MRPSRAVVRIRSVCGGSCAALPGVDIPEKHKMFHVKHSWFSESVGRLGPFRVDVLPGLFHVIAFAVISGMSMT